MQLTLFQKIALTLAGVTALAIGLFITIAPQAFYASYGIQLGTEPSLLSELRAPAACLAALGGIMLAGLIRTKLAPISVAMALTVFIAFPVGRIVSLVADGMPSTSVVGAFAIEVLIAGICLLAFNKRQTNRHGRHATVETAG